MGKPEIRWDNRNERIKLLLRDGLLQIKTFKDLYPGIMHGLIFFGFLVLIFGAAFDATEFHVAEPLGVPFLTGKFYLIFSFLMDLFGLAVLIGVFLAIDRRYLDQTGPSGLLKGYPITHPMMRSSCFCWPESSSPVLSSRHSGSV